MFFSMTKISGNRKTGPIPVSTSSKDTCPDFCPMKVKGCYAKYGPARMHWDKVTNGERGGDIDHFVSEIKALSKGQLWRHNQAGDLPQFDGIIDRDSLDKIVKANKLKKGFTYTHHDINKGDNAEIIKNAISKGFTINLSTNNIAEAIEQVSKNIAPVVTLLPRDAPNSQTVQGHKVVVCPAEQSDKVSCATCGLCQDASRDYIIGFRAHGAASKTVDLIAKGV